MKLSTTKTTAIQDALDAVQRGAYAGVFDATEIETLARDCELRLTRLGLTLAERPGNSFAIQARFGAKRFGSATTIITLTRGSAAWFVTDVVRTNVWDSASLYRLTLGDRTPDHATLGARLVEKVAR